MYTLVIHELCDIRDCSTRGPLSRSIYTGVICIGLQWLEWAGESRQGIYANDRNVIKELLSYRGIVLDTSYHSPLATHQCHCSIQHKLVQYVMYPTFRDKFKCMSKFMNATNHLFIHFARHSWITMAHILSILALNLNCIKLSNLALFLFQISGPKDVVDRREFFWEYGQRTTFVELLELLSSGIHSI